MVWCSVSRTSHQSSGRKESPEEQRSRTMRAVRSKDTSPELIVRRTLRSLGFTGYRLHHKRLTGKPDVAFLGRRKAIFVHGCFWHGHDCPRGARIPKSNRDYWLPKIKRNRERDKEHVAALVEQGWSVLTVWECDLRNTEELADKLRAFMAQ
ncbi:DNA mismatch endonuclease Vsr [Oleiagrimonas citrea]|uniref:Very short patch repair endonuclease n=1 Tax=Oleiagrimonas citrea TaxID=1665687 RepID=A0A846ZLM9_9GAMM|nr:very short patch repair endonuclease [Oleiagrimonas citrea]NKZ38361.1 DNA mismatch endonuclease Vsr [Oleiagrimonas citrea]